MSAECLLDHYSVPLLNSPIGTPGSPLGVCRNCGSLTCGWHGVRTSRGEFLCILCDGLVQAASAAWRAWLGAGGLATLPADPEITPGAPARLPDGASADDAGLDLARALASLFSVAGGGPSPLIAATINQWLAERPAYQQCLSALADSVDWAVGQINRMLGVEDGMVVTGPAGAAYRTGSSGLSITPISAFWARLDHEGRRLMAAFVLLVLVLDTSLDLLPGPAAEIASQLWPVLRDSPGRIEDIRGQALARQ